MWKTTLNFLRNTTLNLKILIGLSILLSFAVASTEVLFAHAATKFALEFIKGGFEFINFDQYGLSISLKITHYIGIAILLRSGAEFLRYFVVSSIGTVCNQYYKKVVFTLALQTQSRSLWRERSKAHYFTSVVSSICSFATSLSQAVCSGVITIFFMATIIYKFPRVGIVVLLAGVLLALVLYVIKNYLRDTSAQYFLSQNFITKTFNSSIRNFIFLKIMGSQNDAIKNLDSMGTSSMAIHFKMNFIQALMFSIPPIFLLGILGVISQPSNSILMGTNGDSLLAVFYILLRLAQQSNSLIGSFGNALRSAKEVDEMNLFLQVFKKTEEEPIVPGIQEGELEDNSLAPKIEFENISFSYNQSAPLYKNFSESINSGECLGISGRSGIGKSTFLNIILGIEEIDHGRVTIGGLEPDIYIRRNPGKIAYVGPEPFLIDGSIKENLLYGNSKALKNEEDMISALTMVGLDKELKNVSMLEQQINSTDLGLSSGQMQRLCIARALTMNPKLLILDEFTANLDKYNEDRILQKISTLKGSTTILIVAHGTNALSIADRVLNLELILKEIDHPKIA